MVTSLHSPILKEKFPNRSSLSQDQLVNFPTSNQDIGNSFEECFTSWPIALGHSCSQQECQSQTSSRAEPCLITEDAD